MSQPQFRAEFDAAVTFTNGGGLQVEGFRLDIPGDDIGHERLASLLIRRLGLSSVGEVHFTRVRIIEEPHEGSRGGPSDVAEVPAGETRLVELSHPVVAGMVTYPGLPGPVITEHLSRPESRSHYAEGVEFSIQQVAMVGNTGTYLDSPFHRYADGGDLASLPLTALVDLPAVVVRLTGAEQRNVDARALAGTEVAGHAVLLHTGGDQAWGRADYVEDAPYLSEDGARWLVDHEARLVGIDAVNIDAVEDGRRPAHSLLLEAGIPVVEHLTGLEHVPVTGATFTAAPPRFVGVGTFPVRAYARVPGSGTTVH